MRRRAEERDVEVLRSEEELDLDRRTVEAGSVRARTVVDHETVEEVVPRSTEEADVERLAAADDDSGEVETLPDGSVSIPVFEERLVVRKELVVRERVVIRKRTVTEDQVITADLRRERVEIDADPAVADRVAEHPSDRSEPPAADDGG